MTMTPPPVGLPLRKDQVVALGMRSGECPVGIIDAADDDFITITLFNWIIGRFVGQTRAVRREDIVEIAWADFATTTGEFQMDPLTSFQTSWKYRHEES